jgi:alpha-L-fucosidase
VAISEYAGYVQQFEFQYRSGSGWRTLFAGTNLGAQFQKRFQTVTAREFRLNILGATEGPTISEMQFFEE